MSRYVEPSIGTDVQVPRPLDASRMSPGSFRSSLGAVKRSLSEPALGNWKPRKADEKLTKRKKDKERVLQTLQGFEVARELKLKRKAEKLRLVQAVDFRAPDVNYGHRQWPLNIPSLEEYINSIMRFVWPEGIKWQNDSLHKTRCNELVREFQKHGVPVSIHADLSHEYENAPSWVPKSGEAFRCVCWGSCLGYKWFNHNDATITCLIGEDWGLERQYLLVHLLRRLITAMTLRYVKDSPEFLDNNYNDLRVLANQDWNETLRWPADCLEFFDEFLEVKGTHRIEGSNTQLDRKTEKLLGKLMGISQFEVHLRVANIRMQKERELRRFPGDPKPAVLMDTDDTVREKVPLPRKDIMKLTLPLRHYWDRYLLIQRMINPSFTSSIIDEGTKKTFYEEGCTKRGTIVDAKFQTLVKAYIDHFLSTNNTVPSRGIKLHTEAAAAYNILARAAGEPAYDPEKPADLNRDRCSLVVDTILTFFDQRRDDIEASTAKPSTYESMEEACLADCIRREFGAADEVAKLESVMRGVPTGGRPELSHDANRSMRLRMFTGPDSLAGKFAAVLPAILATMPESLYVNKFKQLAFPNGIPPIDPSVRNKTAEPAQLRKVSGSSRLSRLGGTPLAGKKESPIARAFTGPAIAMEVLREEDSDEDMEIERGTLLGGGTGQPPPGQAGESSRTAHEEFGDELDEDISGYLAFYETIASEYPTMLHMIRWPVRLVEFYTWVSQKWPLFLYTVEWPRPMPSGPPGHQLGQVPADDTVSLADLGLDGAGGSSAGGEAGGGDSTGNDQSWWMSQLSAVLGLPADGAGDPTQGASKKSKSEG